MTHCNVFFSICLIALNFFSASTVFAVEKGIASYYADRFHGRKTANGQRYHKRKLTAAHNKLPFGTRVKVTNLKTKRSVVVTINDRGGFRRPRIIDLSRRAARKLGIINQGIGRVKLTVL